MAGLALAGNARAATLTWDTSFTSWTASGAWAGSTWNSATPDTAIFPVKSPAGSYTVNLDNNAVVANSITVNANGTQSTRIAANNAGSSLTVWGAMTLNGNVQLHKTATGPAEQFTFQGTGITGAGQLTLNKQATGDLLVGLTGANTSVNPSGATVNVTGSSAGLVGFYGAGNNVIGRDIQNNTGVVRTYLGATTGATVLYSGDSTGGPSAVTQINSDVHGHNGLVSLETGASLLTSSVVVDAGTLLINGGDIGNTTAMVLDGGKLGMGDAGYTETIGTLTVVSNSVIDFGNAGLGSTLFFADSDVNTWGGVLQIWNYTAGFDHLYIGSDDSGMGGAPDVFLGPTQLGPNTTETYKIIFYSDNGNTQILSNGGYVAGTGEVVPVGDIVPVPEPAAVMSVLLLVGVVFWRERSFFTRVRRNSAQPAFA